MSSEDTNKIRVEQPTAQEKVRQLARQVDEVIELLRNQQEILRRRGMNLPSGSMDSLRTLKTRLDSLSKQVVGNQIELRKLRALADTTALIASSLDTDEVLNRVMDTVIHLTGAERGYIVLKNRQTGEFDDFRVARGLDQDQVATPNLEPDSNKRNDFIVSRSIVNDVATKGEPVLTDNASTDERYQRKDSIVGYALRSILAVPLKVRNETIGVVYCDNRILSGLFQKNDLEILNAFSNQAAVAIENARLFESARSQLAQVTQLRDLMNNIFDSIISGVVTTDSKGNVTACNAAACQILSVGVDVVGMPLIQLLPPMQDEFYDKLKQVQSVGMQAMIEVQPEFGEHGRRFWNINASPLRDANGRGVGLALVIDDFTEKKMRELQLAEVGRYLPTALVKHIRSVEDINIAGQEREITAIFADVRGFTSFSERLEPETLMRVINQYLSVASDAINLYEGIVDKYMGDAVTGLFNTQLNPQKDHAKRAVQAALSVLIDVHALHEVLPEEQRLFYGIGIHTGMAVLGNVGSNSRKEFAALGEATDISKILQENANGTVVISEATYEYIKDDFECEQVKLEKNKGRTDLTIGYRVVRRLKGKGTGLLLIDDELADLLKNFKD